MVDFRSLEQLLTTCFENAKDQAFPLAPQLIVKIFPAPSKFGDFQSNIANVLYSQHKDLIGNAESPQVVAQQLKDALQAQNQDAQIFASIDISPQNLICIKLDTQWLTSALVQTYFPHGSAATGCSFADENDRKNLKNGPNLVNYAPSGGSKTVVVDFSSPNIAKDMHVGHLRSTIIGDSLCRVLEFAGHKVLRQNHIGDWGTQFGMLIEFMKEEYPNFLENMPDVTDLQAFYKRAKAKFDADSEFKKRAQQQVVALQSGDDDARKCWQAICEVSRANFNKIYAKLDVNLEERGESWYNGFIPDIIADLTERGLVVESNGAMVIPVPDVSEIPFMVQKSDGGYSYGSTDLAAMWHRTQQLKADWVIIVTDLGQQNHFMSLFDAAKQIGWSAPPANRVSHLGFGVVIGADGKKIKSRSGDTIKLTDLLTEASARAKHDLEERKLKALTKIEENRTESLAELEKTDCPDSDTSKKLAIEQEYQLAKAKIEAFDLEHAAEVLGCAAVKYSDLKNKSIKDYEFSYERALDPAGDTAVTLLYWYSVLCGIQNKCGVDRASGEAFPDVCELLLTNGFERDIALHLLKFQDCIDTVIENLELHHLCTYAWELKKLLSAFYFQKEACQVVGSEREGSRLLLIEASRRVLGKALVLLGCKPLEHMI